MPDPTVISTTTTTTDDIPDGLIRFVEHYLPGLDDGKYTLQASQDVTAKGSTIAPVSRNFVVSGPRFALDPADIHAQYPPAGASSHFAEALPHVVFTKRLLPWERLLPTGSVSIPADQTTPWLALLTFQPGELLVPEGTDPTKAAIAGYAATMTVAELLAQGSSTVRVPHVTPDTADEAALSCQVISISNATFAALVPTRRELPFLAHGREVDVAGKVLLDMPHDGEFSVAVANRFPLPGTPTVGAPCVAHLVSLEGFGDLLNGTAPEQPPQATVKLVSLVSWTFSCLQERSQSFSGLAENLASKGGVPRPAASLMLSLEPPLTPEPPAPSPSDTPAVAVQKRLTDGYVALGYHARTGEDGFAWYRGPLTPSVTSPTFPAGSFKTSDAAMIFDPGSGVFDHSLAAAWQCGRSLGLADQGFAEALFRVRAAARAQVHQMTVGGADQPGGLGDAHEALASLFAAGVLDQIGAASTGQVLPRIRRSASDPNALRAPSDPLSAGSAGEMPSPVQRLQTLLGQPETSAALTDALADNADAAAVAAWLGQLLLLEGIPFDHLVPDARMLPAESLRFFYVDQGWLSALIDGALAIGLGTSEASAVQDLLSADLVAMAQKSALAARATALGLPTPPAPTGPTSGLLIRSALVTGWPGIVVAGTLAGAPVPLLRVDIVEPNVLVAIFDGVPDTVTIEQPHEGLVFGVDDAGQIVMRTVNGPVITNGAEITIYDPDAPTTAFVSLRAGGSRVLNVNTDPAYPAQTPPAPPVDLLGLMAQGLSIGTAAITPATFALQMVSGPDLITFATPPHAPDASEASA